jgi:hypothetical protein
MRHDLYQPETARIAAAQSALLDEARATLQLGQMLRPLEDAGVLQALQVLIENAIGKAKRRPGSSQAKTLSWPISCCRTGLRT